MWLTPEDVRNQVFTTVRLREGYDLSEVDSFLSRVEVVLSALLQQNAGLQSELQAAGQATQQALASRGARPERIIALAQTVADQAVAEAFDKAKQIVAEAEARAASIERNAREEAARMRHEVGGLQEAATEYRSQLKASLEMQLRTAEHQLRRLAADQDPPPPGGAGAHAAGVTLLHQTAGWRVGAQEDGRLADENPA
ncbi:DivIVA domain-containing protein [Streptomyces iakyrus]|uniref:DivIVA domain-containing protein n=1 Tax=Streptomyces iakyrus TaxID=68219 RepID=UPI0033A64199